MPNVRSKRKEPASIGVSTTLEQLVGDIALHEDTPQRRHIRSGAARLIAEKSYHEVGVTEICEAAGIANGALYHHIGSKEELLYNIAARYMTFLLEAGELIAADMPDPVALNPRGKQAPEEIADVFLRPCVSRHRGQSNVLLRQSQLVA